jgi:hypothetical protein
LIPTYISVATDRPAWECRLLASDAAKEARLLAPKLSGASAARIVPISGEGWYGLRWASSYLWFQNQGIRPFTNKALAGKMIPMWIDDPTGSESKKNPKAKTRITRSGKKQVLIFRRAAPIGATKTAMRGKGVNRRAVTVPASYPGAPGRIGRREAGTPWTTPGRRGGSIAKGNVGTRWRHPGLGPRFFLQQGIEQAAIRRSVDIGDILDPQGRKVA